MGQLIKKILDNCAELHQKRAENYSFTEAASDIMNEISELLDACQRMQGKDVQCEPLVHFSGTIIQAGFEIVIFEDENGDEHIDGGNAKIWLSRDNFSSKNPELKRYKAVESFKKVEEWKNQCWEIVREVSEFQPEPEFDEVAQWDHNYKASIREAA